MKKSPNDGGCWFCHDDPIEEIMYFSVEFDCYFHRHCLDKELASPQYNPEAEIIASEHNIPYQTKEPQFEERRKAANPPITNCNNCGAVLKNGRCEYCGTVWEEPEGIDITCLGDSQQQILKADDTHYYRERMTR
jgi:hypothetical protein